MQRKNKDPRSMRCYFVNFNIDTKLTKLVLVPSHQIHHIQQSTRGIKRIKYAFKIGNEYQLVVKGGSTVETLNGIKLEEILARAKSGKKYINFELSGDKIIFAKPLPDFSPIEPDLCKEMELATEKFEKAMSASRLPSKKRKAEDSESSEGEPLIFDKDSIQAETQYDTQVSSHHILSILEKNRKSKTQAFKYSPDYLAQQLAYSNSPFFLPNTIHPPVLIQKQSQAPIVNEEIPAQNPARFTPSLFYNPDTDGNMQSTFYEDEEFENSVRNNNGF